jgi:7,8-dihydroneopterin aldolase/epimerase/oxygenase
MRASNRSMLEFRDARLRVHLGVGAEERADRQDVALGVKIRFAEPPRACLTDRLEGTVCYAELIDAARAIVLERSFHTLEHLAHTLAGCVRERVPPAAAVRLTVTKLNPPVADLPGGVRFSLEA